MFNAYLCLLMPAIFIAAGFGGIVVSMERPEGRLPSELMGACNTWEFGDVGDGVITTMADVASVEVLFNANGVTSSFGTDFTYVEKNAVGELLIIKETFSSATGYKSITPILGRDGDNVWIDCSYVKAVAEDAPIAVGTYCRGKTAATVETIENALDDRHLVTYSTSAPWLDKLRQLPCATPAGLHHGGRYFLRCQRDGGDELAVGADIYVFSSTFDPELQIRDAEFFPELERPPSQDLVFVRLVPESTHEVIRVRLEQAHGGA